MTSPNLRSKAKRWTDPFLALVLLFYPLTVSPQESQSAAAAVDQSIDAETAHKLALASDYHDLAILYIKKGELENAEAEARRIIQLKIPHPFEHAVAESLSIITDKLAEAGRYDIGQNLLDEALKVTGQVSNRIRILRTKARLYMASGENDQAIEAWRQALDLESRQAP